MTKRLPRTTVESDLSAVKYQHRVSRRFELQTTHPLQVSFLKRVATWSLGLSSGYAGPVSWYVSLTGEPMCMRQGVGGRVLSLALGAWFFFLTPAADVFVQTSNRAHELHIFRGTDIVFFSRTSSTPLVDVEGSHSGRESVSSIKR